MVEMKGYEVFIGESELVLGKSEREYDRNYPVVLAAKNGLSAELHLPLVALPGDEQAIALLMTTQCSFEVVDMLNDLLAGNIEDMHPDVIVGLPTLGLPLADGLARRLGHLDYVPLSNSKKFWQDEKFGVPVSSITSGSGKFLYLDQNLLSRVAGKRVVIQDDVANTGESLLAAITLMERAGANSIGISVVMTEGHAWETMLENHGFDWRNNVRTLGHIPMFSRGTNGGWIPITETK